MLLGMAGRALVDQGGHRRNMGRTPLHYNHGERRLPKPQGAR
jgi:hypothetical protein